MIVPRFDVNDAGLRDAFLRETSLSAIRDLDEAAVPRWGRMGAQQMIEHLLWAIELERFLSAQHDSARLFTHPIFGALNHEEWHRAHYKHLHHHLEQFGLIASAHLHDLRGERQP